MLNMKFFTESKTELGAFFTLKRNTWVNKSHMRAVSFTRKAYKYFLA